MQQQFSADNFTLLCDKLAKKDKDLRRVIIQHGYPPLWTRAADFATLVHIILEQQVSLASAKTAFDKLKEKAGDITPVNILSMSDETLKACYFSRQKIKYVRHLAASITGGSLQLDNLSALPDEKVLHQLKQVKGIGEWTARIFLMMCLHRCDCFPEGDVALITSMREIKQLPADMTKESIVALTGAWKPYRTIGSYILWHAYLSKRGKKS